MTDIDYAKIADAANAVMKALADLSSEERQRVLESSAALYGLAGNLRTPAPGQRSSDTAAGAQGSAEGSSGKQLSIVEFLKQKEPATNCQRIACFAYYREHIEKIPRFSRADLSVYFASAKLPAPDKNYARDFGKTVAEGWIHEDGANSYLTQGGEDAVVAGFGGKAKPRGGAVSSKRAKRSKPAGTP